MLNDPTDDYLSDDSVFPDSDVGEDDDLDDSTFDPPESSANDALPEAVSLDDFEEDDFHKAPTSDDVAAENPDAAKVGAEDQAIDEDAITDEELLADDSRPSPQLWGEDVEIPDAATPVATVPKKITPAVTDKTGVGSQRKTKARELALQMLYQCDAIAETSEQDIADQLRERLQRADLFQFAWDLYRGVLRERESLDAMIEAKATNWSLKRMATTDRNVLRLGAYELNHVDTPYGVVLDEAIDMAKKFGAGQSASFVNGVLDKLVPESKRPGNDANATASAAAPVVATNLAEGIPVDEATAKNDPAPMTFHSRASPQEVEQLAKGAPSPIAFKRKPPAKTADDSVETVSSDDEKVDSE